MKNIKEYEKQRKTFEINYIKLIIKYMYTILHSNKKYYRIYIDINKGVFDNKIVIMDFNDRIINKNTLSIRNDFMISNIEHILFNEGFNKYITFNKKHEMKDIIEAYVKEYTSVV